MLAREIMATSREKLRINASGCGEWVELQLPPDVRCVVVFVSDAGDVAYHSSAGSPRTQEVLRSLADHIDGAPARQCLSGGAREPRGRLQ